MSQAAQRRIAFALASGRVDREGGVIRGVAVITEGPALGHGMEVDATTLQQVKTCAETYSGGLKVKLDHSGSAAEIVGYLREFTVDGKTLRADLYLLKSSPRREYILELAETIPDTFGLSIAFSGKDEKRGDVYFARCSEIYSADLVSEPAANPSGLFEAKTDNQPTIPDMTPEEVQKAVEAALSAALGPINEKMAKLEAAMAPKAEIEIEKEDEMQKAKLSAIAKETALAVLREFSASLPAPPKASAPAPEPPATEAKAFEVVVREFKAAGMKHNDAVAKAQREHAAAYDAYLSRVRKGEVILF